jgi:hypothetical protein
MARQSFLLHLAPLPTMKKITLAAGVLAASTFSFSAAPAHAAACASGTIQFGTMGSLPFICDQGDFRFTLTSVAAGFTSSDGISFSNPDPFSFAYSVNSASPWTGATARSINYSVAWIGAPGRFLSSYTASLSSAISNPKAGKYDVTGAAGSAKATLNNGSSTNDEHFYSTPLTLTSDTFLGNLNSITGGGIQSVQGAVYTGTNTQKTPGPLPILGAGAAFGFSRKYRNRIKLAS